MTDLALQEPAPPAALPDIPGTRPSAVALFGHCLDPRIFGLTKAAYKIREASEILSISPAALFADIKAGRLRKSKRRGAALLLAPDLVSYLCNLRGVP